MQKSLMMKCHNCGNRWELFPERWHNMSAVIRNGKRYKVVRCSACNVANFLEMKTLIKQLRMLNRENTKHRYRQTR
jgi:hypothetical protein